MRHARASAFFLPSFEACFRRDTPSPVMARYPIRFFRLLPRGYLSLVPKPFEGSPVPPPLLIAKHVGRSIYFCSLSSIPSSFLSTFQAPRSDQSAGVNLVSRVRPNPVDDF